MKEMDCVEVIAEKEKYAKTVFTKACKVGFAILNVLMATG